MIDWLTEYLSSPNLSGAEPGKKYDSKSPTAAKECSKHKFSAEARARNSEAQRNLRLTLL